MIADLETQHALDRYREAGIAGLTPEEKTLATIWHFESKVANGGFERWYKSPEGELAGFAPHAFRAVGALKLANLAARANAVFGSAGVPADRPEREQRLRAALARDSTCFDALESEYQECEDDLDERLETFAGQHRRKP